MKELSIAEKAKAYDEAIEIARAKYAMKDQPTHQDLVDIFPELVESKDERIRKKIIQLVNDAMATNAPYKKEMLAWLEKQGENTHNKELSELLHKVICRFINDPNIPYTEREKVSMEIIPYVERLEKQGKQKPADKVEPQPAWNEEDETVLNNLIYALANDRIGLHRDEYVDWLKSLRPQNRWKPSDEQINCFSKHIEYERRWNSSHALNVLSELLEQLKKLK